MTPRSLAPPAKPGCSDPRLGARASQALGRPVPADLADHLAQCPACQLERRAFASFERHSERPDRVLLDRIRAAVRASDERDSG